MAKQMFYDSWTNRYILIDSEEITKITDAINKLTEEDELTTASTTEVYLIRKIKKIKELKDQYIKCKEERKLHEKEHSFTEDWWVYNRRELVARDLLLKAIDEVDI